MDRGHMIAGVEHTDLDVVLPAPRPCCHCRSPHVRGRRSSSSSSSLPELPAISITWERLSSTVHAGPPPRGQSRFPAQLPARELYDQVGLLVAVVFWHDVTLQEYTFTAFVFFVPIYFSQSVTGRSTLHSAHFTITNLQYV